MNNNLFSIFDMQKNFYSTSNEMSFKNLKTKLVDFLEVFIKHEKEFIKVIKENLDIPLWDIYFGEIKLIKNELKYFIKTIKTFRKVRLLKNSFWDSFLKQTKSYRQSYGSCLLLLNQTFPISKVFTLLIGALVCGNSIFVKLPNFLPEIFKIIKLIFKEVFNDNYIYFIDENISENDLKTIYDFNFDLVYFDGSPANAKVILRIFAPRFIKVVLDINNKNAVILDETVDLEKTAKKLIWSKMIFAGQTPQSPDFLIIHESIIQAFIKVLKGEYDNQFGKGDKWANLTKIDNLENFDNISAIFNKSIQKNRILFGGNLDRNQRKIEFTLVQVDDLKSPLLSQDFSSPILPVVIFNSFSDINGIVRHNDSPSCIYFFSKNKKRIQNLLKSLESRFFFINSLSIPFLKGLPFGGIKNSGNALYSQKNSIELFSYKKIIVKEKQRNKKRFLNTVQKSAIVKIK